MIGSTDDEAMDYMKAVPVTGDVDTRSRRTSGASQSRWGKFTIRNRLEKNISNHKIGDSFQDSIF